MNDLDICKQCDYCPLVCDGDEATCESAIQHGVNSETGRNRGKFEQNQIHRELKFGGGKT